MILGLELAKKKKIWISRQKIHDTALGRYHDSTRIHDTALGRYHDSTEIHDTAQLVKSEWTHEHKSHEWLYGWMYIPDSTVFNDSPF